MSVCVEEREGVFRFSAQPHFTENTGWTVSNDWSPYDSPWGYFRDRTLTQRWLRSHSGAVGQHAAQCSLSFCLLPCHFLLCTAAAASSPAEETRNCLGCFQLIQSLLSTPLPGSPRRQMASLQFQAKLQGADSSRKALIAQQRPSTPQLSASLNHDSPSNVEKKQGFAWVGQCITFPLPRSSQWGPDFVCNTVPESKWKVNLQESENTMSSDCFVLFS